MTSMSKGIASKNRLPNRRELPNSRSTSSQPKASASREKVTRDRQIASVVDVQDHIHPRGCHFAGHEGTSERKMKSVCTAVLFDYSTTSTP